MLVFLVAAIVVFLVFGYLQLPLLWWTGAVRSSVTFASTQLHIHPNHYH